MTSFSDSNTTDTNDNTVIVIADTNTPGNKAKVSANSDLSVSDVMNAAGVHGAITVGLAAVAARVGASNHTNRKSLTILNNGTVTIYWGFDNTVTLATGMPIFKGQSAGWSAGANITIWLISGTAGQNIRVVEAS